MGPAGPRNIYDVAGAAQDLRSRPKVNCIRKRILLIPRKSLECSDRKS